LRITTNTSNTPRNWSHQIWRPARRSSCRSKGPVSICEGHHASWSIKAL
jgi:hypothetical protein